MKGLKCKANYLLKRFGLIRFQSISHASKHYYTCIFMIIFYTIQSR